MVRNGATDSSLDLPEPRVDAPSRGIKFFFGFLDALCIARQEKPDIPLQISDLFVHLVIVRIVVGELGPPRRAFQHLIYVGFELNPARLDPSEPLNCCVTCGKDGMRLP